MRDKSRIHAEGEVQREQLVDQWTDLLTELVDSFTLDIEGFKTLFCDTWRYFMQYGQEGSVDSRDLQLTNRMACLAFFNNYPENIKPGMFHAVTAIARGFLESLEDPTPRYHGNLYSGYITVEVIHGSDKEFGIDQFGEVLKELAAFYQENGEFDELEEE